MSSSSEVSGGWAMVTLKPCFWRMSETAFQPEPSAKAPCTRTTFLAGAAEAEVAASTAAAARASRLETRIMAVSLRSWWAVQLAADASGEVQSARRLSSSFAKYPARGPAR